MFGVIENMGEEKLELKRTHTHKWFDTIKKV